MVGIYVRVSTEDQAKHGYSLQDQTRECRKKAGTTDIKEYIDDVSGEFLDRPALLRLRQDVKEGLITKIVCLDPDRLSRKLMNQLIITDEFDKRNVELIFVSGDYAKTPEGNLFYSMRGAIAEFEKSKINERMSRGRKQKARQGRVLRDFRIYGYDYHKETAQLIINVEQAQVVCMIFDLFTQSNSPTKGINGIAKYLMDHQIPTKLGGKVWHKQVVRQILLNTAYIGEFYQNKWNTEGMLGNKFRKAEDRIPMKLRPKEEWIQISCPTIIDEGQFNHVQSLLGEAKRRFAKEGTRSYLLSGIVRCGECGNTMTGRRNKNWGKYVFQYTDIKNTAGTKLRGCGRTISCAELDEKVWNTVLSWLNNPGEIAKAKEDTADHPHKFVEITHIEKELEKTKAGRKKLLSLFASGEDIGEEDLRQVMRELKEKEDQLANLLTSIKKKTQENENTEYTQSVIHQAADHYLSKSPKELTAEDKKELIRTIVREVRVFAERIECYSF